MCCDRAPRPPPLQKPKAISKHQTVNGLANESDAGGESGMPTIRVFWGSPLQVEGVPGCNHGKILITKSLPNAISNHIPYFLEYKPGLD